MPYEFEMIVSGDMDVYFIEPSSHGYTSSYDILKRLGWKDDPDAHPRPFVRVQYRDWTRESLRFYEAKLPCWVDENRQEIIDRCNYVFDACKAALVECIDTCTPHADEYLAVENSYDSRKPWEEYAEACSQAWIKYKGIRDAARSEIVNKISAIRGYVPAPEKGDACED
jgi:hypothetical protein